MCLSYPPLHHDVITGPAAVRLSCVLAVLRLLGTPGQLAVPEGRMQELLGVLKGLVQQLEGLHAAVVQVLGSLGTASSEKLFQVCMAACEIKFEALCRQGQDGLEGWVKVTLMLTASVYHHVILAQNHTTSCSVHICLLVNMVWCFLSGKVLAML